MTIYKEIGESLTFDDLIEITMGAVVVWVESWEKAFSLNSRGNV